MEASTLNRKCHHFDEVVIIVCTGSSEVGKWQQLLVQPLQPVIKNYIKYNILFQEKVVPRVGVTKAPFVILRYGKLRFCKSIGWILSIMLIFAKCLHSPATVTPAKYELDIIQVTTVFIIRINCENNGTEKIGLVTPTPAPEVVRNYWILGN